MEDSFPGSEEDVSTSRETTATYMDTTQTDTILPPPQVTAEPRVNVIMVPRRPSSPSTLLTSVYGGAAPVDMQPSVWRTTSSSSLPNSPQHGGNSPYAFPPRGSPTMPRIARGGSDIPLRHSGGYLIRGGSGGIRSAASSERVLLRRSGSPEEQQQRPRAGSSSGSPLPVHGNPYSELCGNYIVKEFMFSTASPDAELPVGFSRHDTARDIYGLDRCKQLLSEYVEQASVTTPGGFFCHPALRPRQIFYMFGPSGFGMRTLVVNYARERRLNLLFVSTPLNQNRYVPGTYATILQRAMQLQPCMVLLDRIGDHWSEQRFQETGSELFAYWRHAGLDACQPPAKLWVVILATEPFESRTLAFQHAMGNESRACVDAIDEKACGCILWRAYADCLRAAGFTDDRPPLPGPFDTTRAIQERERQLLDSQFQRMLLERRQYLFDLAERIHKACTDHQPNGFVLPASLNLMVARAFSASCRRFAAQHYHQTTMAATATSNGAMNVPAPGTVSPLPMSADHLLPTTEEFEEAARFVFPVM